MSSRQVDLALALRELRRTGRYDEARALIDKGLAGTPDDATLMQLRWEHASFWWQHLTGRRLTLTRRGPEDLRFVRRCWADGEFMRRFNHVAPQLPASDDELFGVLVRERATIVSEARALHWTIRLGDVPLGLVSVVHIALGHRRGEFLIGTREGASSWTAPEAAHVTLQFLAQRVGLERLTAYFYPDNERAIEAACSLGFEVEGRLRSYLRLPTGRRSDLIVAGLTLDQDYFHRTARMRRRLTEVASSSPAA